MNYLKTVVAAMVILTGGARAAEDAVFDVPKIADIVIDGKSEDWGDQGLKIDAMADASGKRKSASDFNPKFRLGWNEKGLLILATVVDDVALEPAEKIEDLWKGDSIEVFVGLSRGCKDTYQVVIAPGRDPAHPELRKNLSDYRKTLAKKEPLKIDVARQITPNGYIIEALLPWKNLNIEAAEGKTLAVQVYANDTDKPDQRFQALWFPKSDTYSDTNNMYTIRLVAPKAAAAGAEITMVDEAALKDKSLKIQQASYDDEGRAEIVVTGAQSAKRKSIKIKDGDETVGKSKLEAAGDQTMARVRLDKKDTPFGTLTVLYDDEAIGTVKLPPAPEKK